MGHWRKSWVYLLIFMMSCSGVGSDLTPGEEGESGDGSTGVESGGDTAPGAGAGGSDEETADSLYSSGPLDIPVPIAKVESIDPRHVVVSLSSNRLTLRGETGAVTNVASSPMVWCQHQDSGEIKTTSTNPDGSFPEIEFSSSGIGESAFLTLAGFNGTEIGTPVFIKISDNLYVWLLTNGSSVSKNSVTFEDDRVYMVINVNGASTSRNLKQASTSSSSYVYTFDVGGIPEILATGNTSIDQLFVTEGEMLIRSGNTFYIPESSGFKSIFSIGALETILQVDVESDYSDKQWIAVATDLAAYVCDRTGSCTEVADFDALSAPANFQEIVTATWSKYLVGTDPLFFLQLVWQEESSGSTSTSAWNYEPGDTLEEVVENWGWFWYETDNVDLTGLTPGTYVYKGVLKQGTVDNYVTQYRPATWGTSCSGTLSGGNVAELTATIIQTEGNFHYLLDAEVTVDTYTPVTTGSTTVIKDSVCYAKPTRVVYDAEIHPNMDLIFFCAEDSNGRGQMYTLCVNQI
ncbi:MAG: hypothetical protein Q7T11_05135, partial [Deltaproteobacteria bacterium]|nr:hypothetical protein [Deltaproteobacteria bacterium]